MRTRNLVIYSIVVMFLLAAATSHAQMGMGHKKGGSHGMMGKQGHCLKMGCVEQLGLKSDQIKQLKDIRFDVKKKLIPLQADLRLAKLELHEMLSNDASKNAIHSKIDAVEKIKSEIHKIKIDGKLAFRNLLTAEQKEKLDALPMGGCGRMGRHHGRGAGFGMMDGDCNPREAASYGFSFGDCPWIDDSGI